jgi:hypothetical protein
LTIHLLEEGVRVEITNITVELSAKLRIEVQNLNWQFELDIGAHHDML